MSENEIDTRKSRLQIEAINGITYLFSFFGSWVGLSLLLSDPVSVKFGSRAAGGFMVLVLFPISFLIAGSIKFLVHHYIVRKKYGAIATEIFYGAGSSKYLDKR